LASYQSARSDGPAATRLACSGWRTHEQCRGLVIDPDSLAVQLWAIPDSTDNELLGFHRCVHRLSGTPNCKTISQSLGRPQSWPREMTDDLKVRN